MKLFRKIRQNLLPENKVIKYLIYASGEIVLVVIGIFLALQLNNWNEERKVRDHEAVLLSELRIELNSNRYDIVQTILAIDNSIKSNKVIASRFENHLPYHDSLASHFANLYSYTFFIINNTTYDKLKTTGIDIIQNKELRNLISDLYTFRFIQIERMENLYMHEHYVNYIKPIYMKEFTTFDWPNSLEIKDYESFIRNSDIKQILNYTIANLGTIKSRQQALADETERIIGLIDKE